MTLTTDSLSIHVCVTIVNRKTDMVRKAGKLQRFFAQILMERGSRVDWNIPSFTE